MDCPAMDEQKRLRFAQNSNLSEACKEELVCAQLLISVKHGRVWNGYTPNLWYMTAPSLPGTPSVILTSRSSILGPISSNLIALCVPFLLFRPTKSEASETASASSSPAALDAEDAADSYPSSSGPGSPSDGGRNRQGPSRVRDSRSLWTIWSLSVIYGIWSPRAVCGRVGRRRRV